MHVTAPQAPTRPTFAQAFPQLKEGTLLVSMPGAVVAEVPGFPGDIPYPAVARWGRTEGDSFSFHNTAAALGLDVTATFRTAADGGLDATTTGSFAGAPYNAGAHYSVLQAREGYIQLQMDGGSGKPSEMSITQIEPGVSLMKVNMEMPLGGFERKNVLVVDKAQEVWFRDLLNAGEAVTNPAV